MRGTRPIIVALGSVACGLAAAGLSLRLADRTAAGSAVALAASVLMVTLGFAMIVRQKPAFVFLWSVLVGLFSLLYHAGLSHRLLLRKALRLGCQP